MKLQRRETNGFAPELNELLIRRAARIKHKPPESLDDNLLWVAEFPVGEETYAIPLEKLRAAVPLKMVTPVPLSPPHVVGSTSAIVCEKVQRCPAKSSAVYCLSPNG